MEKKSINWLIVAAILVGIIFTAVITVAGTLLVLHEINEERAEHFQIENSENFNDPATSYSDTYVPSDPAEKILSGDFTDFAGTYSCGNAKCTLLSNGILTFDGFDDGLTYDVINITKEADGSYSWVNSCGIDAFWIRLFPIGVEVTAYDGTVIPSDTSLVRLVSGNGDLAPGADVYCRN